MDKEWLLKMAERKQARAHICHKAATFEKAVNGRSNVFHSHLNDFFYNSGYANAYRGLAAQMELVEVIEREMDEEATCP